MNQPNCSLKNIKDLHAIDKTVENRQIYACMHVQVYVYTDVCSWWGLPKEFALLTTGVSAHNFIVLSKAKLFSLFLRLLVMSGFALPAIFNWDYAMHYICHIFKSYEVKIQQGESGNQNRTEILQRTEKVCRAQSNPIQNCYTFGKTWFLSTIFSSQISEKLKANK